MDLTLALVSIHVVFLLLWAGTLIYFPTMVVEEACAADAGEARRMMLMQRWIYAQVMTPAALLAVATGTALVFDRGFTGGWFPVKLVLVMLMAFFHMYCGTLLVAESRHGAGGPLRYYRALPIVPLALAAAVVLLVTGKPF